MEHKDYDVIVAGAGPTGFILAIDLGRRGVRVLLLEKESSTKPWPKMDRSNARTMEIFRRLGIADQVRALGYPAEASMDVFIATKLSTEPLLRLEYPTVAECRERIAESTGIGEPLEPYQLVSQNALEPLLRAVAEEDPNVDLRFGLELVSFEQDDDGVDVVARDASGAPTQLRAGYLVGTDGGRSVVRKGLGIELAGRGGIAAVRQVVFQSDDLFEKIPIGEGRHYHFSDEWNSTIVVQGSRREFTLNGSIPDGADLVDAVRTLIGFDADIRVSNSVPWKYHLLLADRYRERRVFIAGDAAHLVIPTGGLGMNSGVGDAIDLSWKLAATIQGWAGPAVLESYEVERRAVGRRNVEAAGWAAAGMMKWRECYTPDVAEDTDAGRAKRREIAEVARVHLKRVYDMVGVELGYSYAGSELVVPEPNNPAEWDTTRYEPHTRPGIRLPHIWLSDGTAIQDIVSDDYTLLDLTGVADSRALELSFAEKGIPLQVVSRDEPHVREVYGTSVVLVRPDMHIFWRGDRLPDDLEPLARRAAGRTSELADARVVHSG